MQNFRELKIGVEMNFDAIEGLDENNITILYSDIVNGLEDSDNRLAGCCCRDSRFKTSSGLGRDGCEWWCGNQRSFCGGWDTSNYGASCNLSC